mmetsp:Transcript_73942/g.66559  ORF Transcript_73942/g.66559 Transcript_73942/m.66559 type:complete len:384 (+) Transcript_73942:84-1235(+)|eukprot:CAMPEP_0201572004 /NCGR_PEP_ID=MMETSP0190_2-20130828/15050_1 /ASSEMBLY_ACC=CAM_ASM_000263 /TAXON_ID=37353 /ORGANISM="Rosalina sp." /LENGTH=383 /DNA_ID=CAMNT_0047997271 /DNA_START=84 /DNA_END=1235 /DNA_ORIENTATION=-
MTSNDKDTESNQEFTFGEYVSPNPKSISLGVKLKPEPLISYKTDKTVKTESKSIQQQRQQLIDNEKKNDCDNDENITINISKGKPEIVNKISSKRIQPTPLKIKVSKQQNEIESLKAQLFKLQIENEKLKSNSNSVTPQNEIQEDENQDLVKKNISFNESVNILDAEIDPEFNIKLTDKPSIMRSNRNSTPYKPKSVKPKQIQNVSHLLASNDKENNKENQNVIPIPQNKQSRGAYRITPIPVKKGQKRITFKTRLQNIRDKTQENAFLNELSELIETPKNLESVKNMKTPMGDNDDNEQDESVNLSFNLGGNQPRTSTPSFLKGMESGNSSFVESTPDLSNMSVDLTKTGNGASNFVSPILTPSATSKQNAKPFLFSWNKKK